MYVGTTSEDDGAPPPLPLKVRDADVSLDMGQRTDPDAEADYCNLSATPEHVRRVPSTPSLRAKVIRQQTTIYQLIWILSYMQEPLDFFDTLIGTLSSFQVLPPTPQEEISPPLGALLQNQLVTSPALSTPSTPLAPSPAPDPPDPDP